uniref:Protein kinase domain-containing protein n=1 Tax=Chromera velia CCMP2878 TaxID=1169474 RepID=A0A0G4FV08_9ALVE|eukprot:Cvel_18890.t1-p1 / transcript=Cvel_18890.t1 / gene=Cvel_18890 / organism=Chromera_velia_CCMP2878 / gene_product=Serine/threonine-protein kinase fused, putative / transcript_product=Serine/threonine-protein kinase fused, putative / location=Cvel_scaffold1591:37339-37587(-) / protein_length=83 / sequence_SO=supercontig / SO=protein_coding / is_pseudo=false
MHAMMYINRDLKPENILFVDLDQNVIKLCDFGLAKDTTKETGAEEHRGTRMYQAPEVFAGGAETELGDMWALGCILFEASLHE